MREIFKPITYRSLPPVYTIIVTAVVPLVCYAYAEWVSGIEWGDIHTWIEPFRDIDIEALLPWLLSTTLFAIFFDRFFLHGILRHERNFFWFLLISVPGGFFCGWLSGLFSLLFLDPRRLNWEAMMISQGIGILVGVVTAFWFRMREKHPGP